MFRLVLSSILFSAAKALLNAVSYFGIFMSLSGLGEPVFFKLSLFLP